jgi:Ca-activated chloride channel family protein
MLEFHFLRPLWLLLLPLGIWLAWRLTRATSLGGRWRSVIDAALQPYVLTGGDVALRERRAIIVAGAGAWILATLALAGPTWERQLVPAFRSDEALVVVLDLSRSMDAADLEPSRLARAKLKLLDLLERRASGQTGLVVFSAHAFTVTPLTTDTRNIAALVTSLSTDIMPSRGSYPEAGLTKAAELLRQAGLRGGELLLVSDAAVSTVAEREVERLNDEGYTTHVLAIGTAEGAPIPESGGGFLTDAGGRVVVPQLDARALRRLALIGGGRFATLSTDGSDLDTLLGAGTERGAAIDNERNDGQYRTDIWQDRGVWLVLLLLPFVASAFRRGWVVGCALLLSVPGPRAEALEWADLWLRPDQRGQRALEAQQPARAAELFEDPEWEAAARYRAGDYTASAERLEDLDTADAQYNRGNALARSGNLAAAIRAYDRALELDPMHEDARYNRELLREQPPEGQDAQQPASEGEDDGGTPPEQGQEQSPATQAGETPSPEGVDPATPESARDVQAAQDATESATDREDTPPPEAEPMPTAGDLENWASEQAADQWLRRIRQDPGGLLRRKFLFQYQRQGIDQDGNYIWPGDEEQPW